MREPKTYNEVVNNPINRNRLHKAIDEEFWNLNFYQTYCYTIIPLNYKHIGCKCVFKIKYYSNRFIKRYNIRIIAQSFLQLHNINYTEIFAPKIKQQVLRIFLAIVIMPRITLLQINVIGIYIESFLG